ncbi:helix-turn-helix domain-containing protein [Gordonia sp. (in: high G+C Gram-positive bacteria)]|uniref:helix-turn-helix domain-containing protein n=1 Tax=Gordonia sp. (in: high G+C Gram-positive bacteria) TaxID=84139 RepID=UPI00261DBA14|nr:helix-turn-helix domain-containing protein [Gordonia sp. (in: high G+C Gram-positive bacteria)]
MTAGYDQHTVDHVIAGYRMPLTTAERREVVHQLTEAGWSVAELAEHLGVARRTIDADRRLWTPQPADTAVQLPPRPYPAESFDDKKMRAAAARFIGAVHELDNAWELTAAMPPDDIRALCIVLAAACDPDKPITEMLAWVDRLGEALPATA